MTQTPHELRCLLIDNVNVQQWPNRVWYTQAHDSAASDLTGHLPVESRRVPVVGRDHKPNGPFSLVVWFVHTTHDLGTV